MEKLLKRASDYSPQLNTKEVLARIQLLEGETTGEQELRDSYKGKIAHFKIPRHFGFVAELPRTVNGKMKKQIGVARRFATYRFVTYFTRWITICATGLRQSRSAA